MKKFLAIVVVMLMALSCCGNVFAATGNMSSWFNSSTAQTMQIIQANENLMSYDKRINSILTLYGIYDVLGEANVDTSAVEAPFNDMGVYQPYSKERKALTWLYLKGILKGYDDGSVRPEKEITRAEYAALLVRMLENSNLRASANRTNPYSDIDGHWAYDVILKATALGLVQGDGSTFRPDAWITKEEVITIGLRLADSMELDVNDYADIIDDIYDVEIDYPIYTDGWGKYDYSKYDYVIDIGESENIHFDSISSISSYTTSKTGIVSITKYTGYLKVTGKTEGTVSINAKSKNGYQETVQVLVQDPYSSNKSYTVRVGGTTKVYAPSRANIRSYSISSGGSFISVTKNTGYLSVYGKSTGTAKIKITDYDGRTDTVTVKVSNSSYSSGRYDDAYEYEVEKGDTVRVYAPSGNNIRSYNISSGSSYVSVEKYSSYLSVYGKTTGTAKLKITDTSGETETVTVYVEGSSSYAYGRAYGLTDTIDLDIGDTENIYFENIYYIDDYDVSKSGIVTVSQYNRYLKVTAKSKGTVTITAYDDDGNSEKIKFIVSGYDYSNGGTSYGLTDTYSLEYGDTESIYFDYITDIYDYDVSKSGIVTVSQYNRYLKVTAKSEGTVTITVYDDEGNSEKIKVIVESDDGSSYGVTRTYNFDYGETQNIYFSNIDNISSYEISKNGIVTITKYNGYLRVTPKSEGTVIITVYDRYGYSESIRITVGDYGGSYPPEREIIYPPSNVKDIS